MLPASTEYIKYINAIPFLLRYSVQVKSSNHVDIYFGLKVISANIILQKPHPKKTSFINTVLVVFLYNITLFCTFVFIFITSTNCLLHSLRSHK